MLENLLLELPRAEIYEAGIYIAKGFVFLSLLLLGGFILFIGLKRI